MIHIAESNHVRTAMPPKSDHDWALTALLEGWTEEQVHQRLRRRLHGVKMARVWSYFYAFHTAYAECEALEEQDACSKRHPRALPWQVAKKQSKEDKRAGRPRPVCRKTPVKRITTWARNLELHFDGRWFKLSDINALPGRINMVLGLRWSRSVRGRRNRTDAEINRAWLDGVVHAEQKALTNNL